MKTGRILLLITLGLLIGCSSGEIKPVDIFPEDMCAHCRMAVTDERYASEIITTESEVFKFDDIGCLDKFRNGKPGLQVAGIYYKDFDTKNWLPEKEAHIVRTSAKTPMASGKVAFADSSRAAQFAGEHPPSEGMNLSSEGSDCTCCDSKGE